MPKNRSITLLPSAQNNEATVVNEVSPTQATAPKQVAPVSLDAQIGQMVMIGFPHTSVTEQSSVVQDIVREQIGGVFLFPRNLHEPMQLRQLIRSLQATARAAGVAPLLVGVDQEGGQVSRLGRRFGFESNYSAQELGTRNDRETTRLYAEQMAELLNGLGINLNLAPVVDLNVNPRNPVIGGLGRSFSADPTIVIRHALDFIRPHRWHGVVCALKHFPGHGSSQSDSHRGFVDVTETWSELELEPYAAVIDADECDLVMTAHVFNGKIDSERPATLSRATITGILRKQLGYDGVVMTDDILMRAIRNHYSLEESVRYAIDAGVDIISVANTSAQVATTRVTSTIRALVADGIVSEERIYASYRRIQELKQRFDLVG